MNEVRRIQRQMKLLHVDEGWASITLRDLLEKVDTKAAIARPITNAHSIWEIVLHLGTAQQLILDHLQRITRKFEPGDAWPPILNPSEEAWEQTRGDILEADKEIRARLDDFPSTRLDQPLHKGGSSAYDVLHGYIQHAYYHAGQIQVLVSLTIG